MLEIKLNNTYKIITEDDLNIVLYRKTDKNKIPKHFKASDKITWKLVGYYISIEYLVDDLAEREIKLLDAKTLKELLSAIKDLKTSICHAYAINLTLTEASSYKN